MKHQNPARLKAHGYKLLLILLLVIADMWSKARFADADTVLIPHFVRLLGTRNTGVAFSLFSHAPWAVAALSCVMAPLLTGLALKAKGLPAAALCLMAAGTLGNAIDRVFRGYVIDFIQPLFVRFAVFNAADVFLTVGAGLMMIDVLFFEKNAPDKPAR